MSENPGNPQRLLIVDDSKVIRVTARKILQNHFETVEAVDGNDAWNILETQPPFALVVSDLTMPGMDGFELLEKIRHSQQPRIRELPVIIITGANDSESTMQRATDAGATDFIGKPFDAVHLLARTQSHANGYMNRQSLAAQTISQEDQARQDPVTGLANEAALIDHGYQLLSYAIRHRTGFAVMQIEVDGYDRIFRQHGAGMGQSVIKYVAGVLQDSIRGEDLVARTGPARFALLLSGISLRGMHHLAARICDDIRNRSIRSGNTTVRFTVSIGVAAPEITPDARFDALLHAARTNLHEAILNGGDKVVCDSHTDTAGNPPGAAASVDVITDRPANISQITAAEPVVQEPDYGIELSIDCDLEDIEVDAAPAPDSTDDAPAPAIAVVKAPASETEAQRHQFFLDGFAGRAEEETIVITAPYSIFEESEGTAPLTDQTLPEAAPAGSRQLAADPVDGSGQSDSAAAESIVPAGRLLDQSATAVDTSTDADVLAGRRRGLFSRLAGIFSRRHKTAHDD